jgi:hypothetical protein
MARNQFDVEDVPFWGALVLGIVSLTGIGTISIFGYGLGDQMFTLFNETVPWAAALVLVGGLGIMVTNGLDSGGIISMMQGERGPTRDDDMLGQIAQVGIIGIVAVPFLMVFIPGFNDFVTTSDIIGGTVAVLVTLGAGLAAYEH